MKEEIQFLKSAFQINLGIANKKVDNIVNIGHELYMDLNKIFEDVFGKNIYKCDISPENLMTYKNGKVSSILKNEKEFSGHYGFDVISITNMTDILMNKINASMLNQIINRFYNNIALEIINSIQNMEYQINDRLVKMKENEYADEISSYKLLLEEIASEVELIVNNNDKKIPYITNIINMRININKIFEYYMRKLSNWENIIGQGCFDNFGENPNINLINFDELNSDICFSRQIISIHLIALVYENLLSGSIDLKSKNIVADKIHNYINRYNNYYEIIKQKLIERDKNNKLFNWFFRWDKKNDSSNIDWLLTNINNDNNFEINVAEDIFNQINNNLQEMILIE